MLTITGINPEKEIGQEDGRLVHRRPKFSGHGIARVRTKDRNLL